MAGSITGPFHKGKNVPGYYRYSSWFRQGRPYTTPLPYYVTEVTLQNFYSEGSEGFIPLVASYGVQAPAEVIARANNEAYKKFSAKLGSTSSVGVTLAEVSQSVNMIAARATSLLNFVRSVRRGRLFDAYSYLFLAQPPRARVAFQKAYKSHKGMSIAELKLLKKKNWARRRTAEIIPKSWTRESQDFANVYLEFHFGWAPLVNDIYDSIQVLTKDWPKTRVSGSGAADWKRRSDVNQTVTDETAVVKVRIQADMVVTNPNLYLARNLGLVNPASIAWELVPFSFVVDWFANVGDVLDSYTDLVGLSADNAFTTIQHIGSYSSSWSLSPPKVSDLMVTKSFSLQRKPGFTGPVLQLKPFRGFSVRRGAAAISLLVQSLR